MVSAREMAKLHRDEPHYVGDPEVVGARIAHKEFHGVVGPTTVGKTTLLDRVIEIMPDSHHVPSTIDRERKEGDPLDYRTLDEGVTTERLVQDIKAGHVVNYATFPTGNTYVTYPGAYRATHNFLPTMTSSIEQLSHAGFKKFSLHYVFMSAAEWEQLIKKKSFNGKRVQRMQEADTSLTYALEHPDQFSFIRNRLGNKGLKQAATDLMLNAMGADPGVEPAVALAHISEMRDVARRYATKKKVA